jgi:hypothetical protein
MEQKLKQTLSSPKSDDGEVKPSLETLWDCLNFRGLVGIFGKQEVMAFHLNEPSGSDYLMFCSTFNRQTFRRDTSKLTSEEKIQL